MNKIFAIFLLIPLIAAFQYCSKEKKHSVPLSKNTHALVLRHNTSVRIDPFIFSTRISQLSKGAVVEITGKSQERSKLGKTDDYWYKINFQNSVTGWIYGSNLHLFNSKKKSKDQILAELYKKDTQIMLKSITGRWWSLNRFGEFSSYCIELHPDRTFKAFRKGKEDKPKEGTYTINMPERTINFDTSFYLGKILHFKKRGKSYLLYLKKEKNSIRFKQIAQGDTPEEDNKK